MRRRFWYYIVMATLHIDFDDPTVPLVDEFWDCECKPPYPAITSSDRDRCPICNARRDDCPNSRLDEVLLVHPGIVAYDWKLQRGQVITVDAFREFIFTYLTKAGVCQLTELHQALDVGPLPGDEED